MGVCNIDHSREDVVKKLKSQENFLPEELNKKIHHFLKKEHSQETLNEVFHLLKKYDLAEKSEQEDRNEKFSALIG
ncbi:group-specific protein [Virgibacillus profundi]|uniref:Group-specific protein n=1 Tax=Virgibacillus profundi TaxID=2024555 RepID=A0A2A2IFL6_9BACI|nr:group-specific protein [Virgibacillus profundi]PAV30447.1 group-specific protein [Virgibacillus profundi]PXY54619.1 group-specific protein [Virgibacillus profundi]